MGEGYSKAHWAKDDTAVNCKQCNSKFTFSRRRHHCRNCGYIFCEDCSFRTQPVPNRNINDHVRVCDDCYFALVDSGNAPTVAKSESRLVERRVPAGQQHQQQQQQQTQHQNSSSNSNPAAAASANSVGSSADKSGTQAPNTPATPPLEHQAQATIPAPVAPAVKSQEQRLQERLAVVMQTVRQVSVYLEADAVVTEGVNPDEEPNWADESNFALEFTTADRYIIPFPQGYQDGAANLLLGDVRPPRKSNAADTSAIWNEDAKKGLVAMITPFNGASNPATPN
ncbi:Hypothetical protein, putative [Bodo saltans]|uniref:FYVE-type domain-containing protein n=1 Tax=Bodo saltans TaxID=75058 RepID=A0A0S4IKI0_BODSA|nr:Hypothetical protein, putative [Bodo saltans]|eukprot:CUE66333.1 Hypothetical protein, putative [Bodo saltans]